MSPVVQISRHKDKIAKAVENLKNFADNLPSSGGEAGVDKVLPITGLEYFLGTPIKVRPVRIKYLRDSKDFQVTAGAIHFLKKREYQRDVPTKDGEGTEKVTKHYWTFLLDDGSDRVQCVFFPNSNTAAKFEKLADRTVVCVTGIHEKKNDRTSFRVTGVSFCEFIKAEKKN